MALDAEEQEAQCLLYQTMMGDEPNGRLSPRGGNVACAAAGNPMPAYASHQQWPGDYHSTAATTYPMQHHSNLILSSTYQPIVPSSPCSTDLTDPSWQMLRPQGYQNRSGGGSGASRSPSPNPSELHNFGFPLADGKSWRCKYPGCSSHAIFTRGCDLRKHYRRHTKTLFCRHESCSQSGLKGFSSKKDRDRHEASHTPQVACEWEGCDRTFSRVDNMKDHVRRIHSKSSR